MQTEFFRHLRPHWFNRERMQIEPLTNGGISFLLFPVAEKTYDYWVYICPEDAMFSAKAAVKKLRQVKKTGTAPWGTIILTNKPIIDILCDNASLPKLPSNLADLIKKIKYLNERAEADCKAAQIPATREYYEVQ